MSDFVFGIEYAVQFTCGYSLCTNTLLPKAIGEGVQLGVVSLHPATIGIDFAMQL